MSDDGVINTSPRPRMLVRGFDKESKLIQQLLALAPTAKHIQHLSEVRQAEWDLLVTDRQTTEPAPAHSYGRTVVLDAHVCVVLRVRPEMTYGTVGSTADCSIQHDPTVISAELRRCRGLPQRIADLTHEQLEPVVRARPQHSAFQPDQGTPDGWQPFLETADGDALAAKFRRSPTAEQWLLPRDTPDLIPWVKAALAEWHTLAPDRFPGVPDWSHQEAWSTADERRIRADIAAVERARVETLHELDEQQAALKQQLAAAREAGDAYERRLLTAQDDELRVAVMLALRELGLHVVDADAEAMPGDDLEDLRAQDPDAPGWETLVEVKGYSKGAKTEAIGQFMRFQKRYVAKAGRMADAEWYVVNQFLGRDPSSRQRVLQGSQGDVDAFAAGSGLVIDTVVLFRLLMDVREGKRLPQEVRQVLRTSTGRLEV